MIKYLFFDRRDHELIRIVNSAYGEDSTLDYTQKLYYPFFHPLGIKELAESKGLRTAYSIVNLLESMERGEIENRLQAIKGLRDDIFSTADGPMPKNTARVLLQIMKELVRAKGNYPLQLQLAHDFRLTAFGKPRIIRKQLKHHHLLEMPEEWNQLTFDDHVHDANTSGRKSPTHLIMDAWIKGIRRLRVIYYHYIEPKFAAELIEAARIMEIDLRIGIEFWARHRNCYISFTWVSRELPDAESFLCFLAEPHVVKFMEQGKAVLKFQEKLVLRLLDNFNNHHFDKMCQGLDIEMEKLCPETFLKFTFPGQPSIIHLGEYIYSEVVKSMRLYIEKSNSASDKSNLEEQKKINNLIEKMNFFNSNDIISTYLCPQQQPGTPHPFDIPDNSDTPDRLKLNFKELFENIKQLHHAFRITLNLGNLKPEDVLEILYDSNGVITRLEIINLKSFNTITNDQIFSINELQKAINQGSLLKLKRIARQIIQNVSQSDYADKKNRLEKLIDILHDIDALKNMYAVKPLKSRIGSDSSGKSYQTYGMGFGIIGTLPLRAKKEILKHSEGRLILPAKIQANQRLTILRTNNISPMLKYMLNVVKHLPGLNQIISTQKKEWMIESFTMDMDKKGNVVTLGGKQQDNINDLGLDLPEDKKPDTTRSWKNLNTKLKNCIKIFIGFVPAFLCFAFTKDWWFLAYFGAFIWFFITGIRNVVQSVLGGGGIRRSSMLKWNDYISWDRLTDSLLYTGFSVPLLDYIVKTVLLDRTFGINTATNPLALYSVMALANGIYLSSHNAFRGLPKGAITGNFFRSIISIPVAILFNSLISTILRLSGVPGVEAVLQKWAAIISKAASDVVAGVIEGTADRFHNMGLRKRDINKKFSDLFTTYSKLALLFPETEELNVLENPKELFNSRNSEIRDLAIMIIINSLDLFYFWMYLPRAKTVMLDMVARLTPEEKIIFMQSQKILEHEQHISRLFVDGILGRNFPRPLSFYLTTYKNYLSSIKETNQNYFKAY